MHTKYWGYTFLSLFVILSFRLSFPSIYWERIDGIRPNFVYALTLTRSKLGSLCVIFCKYTTQLWPLVIVNFVSAQYLRNKLMEFDKILHIHLCWSRSRLELLHIDFLYPHPPPMANCGSERGGILFLHCASVCPSISPLRFGFWGVYLISTLYWHFLF